MKEKFAIFDMDGTLTDSMEVWRESQKKLLARYNAVQRVDVSERVKATTPYEGAAMLCREYGLPITPEQMQDEIKEIVAEGYRTAPLKPGILRVLQELQAKGVKMCVLSSTSQDLMLPMLARLNLNQYFLFTESCHDGHGKSTAEPYLEAMKRLGASDPGQVAVFEDAWHAVKSASEGGFAVYAIADPYAADHLEEIKERADVFLNCWDELVIE